MSVIVQEAAKTVPAANVQTVMATIFSLSKVRALIIIESPCLTEINKAV
jgi:hypothetical protein